jgi:creatinine amidohydrolase
MSHADPSMIASLLEARMSQLVASDADEGGARPLVLLPTGAVEQHGPHLPVGTDSLMAWAVAVRAAERAQTSCLVAPPVWFGFSPHHLRFGATVSVRAELYVDLIRSLAQDLHHSFGPVLVVNGHGGNRGLLSALDLEGVCSTISYWEVAGKSSSDLFGADRGSIGHAGQIETSLMLALWPSLVGDAGGPFEPVVENQDQQVRPDLGRSGVIGDPGSASAALGASFLEDVVQGLADLIDRTLWGSTHSPTDGPSTPGHPQ